MRTLLATLGLWAVTAPSALAQATVQGRVTDVVTGEPVVGAVVRVVGTGSSTKTGAAGLFHADGLAAGRVTLRVEAPRYVSVVAEVTLVDGAARPVKVEMSPVSAVLDEVRVLVRRWEDRAEGTSLQRLEPTPPDWERNEDVPRLLGARVPGASVLRSDGEVGTGYRILLRGVNTITLDSRPLVVLDGVRLAPATGGTLLDRMRLGDPLGLIDPNSIDRIEVLRGPAASARYGPEASSGVILIYTHRG